MDYWSLILPVAGIAAIAFVVSRAFERVTVYEYQHALHFVKGRLKGILPPGAYWLFTPNSAVEVIDARPRVITIPGQEVISSDGVSLKVSVLVEYQVLDPKICLLNSASFMESLYAHVQAALREAIGDRAIDQVLESRATLGQLLKARTDKKAAELGLELKSTSVKDIMFPGPLKDSFSQAARAKQEGLAALERARGESAAMRSLANAARLMEDNPNLYQLRLLQALGDTGKVVLRLDRGQNAAETKK